MEAQLKQIHFGTQRIVCVNTRQPTGLLLILIVTMTVLYLNSIINAASGLDYRDAIALILSFWRFLACAYLIDQLGLSAKTLCY